MGDYHGSPWLVHLVDKILMNSTDVINLLPPETIARFYERQDKGFRLHAIRAYRQYLDFTRINSSFLIPSDEFRHLNKQDGAFDIENVWYKVGKGGQTEKEEFFPVLEKDNHSVLDFLRRFGWERITMYDRTYNLHTKHCHDDFRWMCWYIKRVRARELRPLYEIIIAFVCLKLFDVRKIPGLLFDTFWKGDIPEVNFS